MKKIFIITLIVVFVMNIPQTLKGMDNQENQKLYFSEWHLYYASMPPKISTQQITFKNRDQLITFNTNDTFLHDEKKRTGQTNIFVPSENIATIKRALTSGWTLYVEAHRCSHVIEIKPENVQNLSDL